MNKIKLLLLLLTFSINVMVHAQTLKTYSGPMNGFNKVTYTYYEAEDGQRIWHGKFTAFDRNKYFTRKDVGTFKNGNQCGAWTTVLESSSYRESLLINYDNSGMPTGTLKYSYFDKKRGRVTIQLAAVLSNNLITGPFSGKYDYGFGCPENVSFSGTADAGVCNGIWKLIVKQRGITKTYFEKWENDRFLDYYKFDSSTGDKIPLSRIDVRYNGVGIYVQMVMKKISMLQFARGAEDVDVIQFYKYVRGEYND